MNVTRDEERSEGPGLLRRREEPRRGQRSPGERGRLRAGLKGWPRASRGGRRGRRGSPPGGGGSSPEG